MINDSHIVGFFAGVGATLILLVVCGLGFLVIRPWLRLKLMGGQGTLLDVLAMRLRGNPAQLIVEAYTSLLHDGCQVRLREVESQYVARRAKIVTLQDLLSVVRESKQREKDETNEDSRRPRK